VNFYEGKSLKTSYLGNSNAETILQPCIPVNLIFNGSACSS